MADRTARVGKWTAALWALSIAGAAVSGCGGSGNNGSDGGGGSGGSPFAGTWTGSEEYVQGTFANPTAIENLGFTTLIIDATGNIQGQTFDSVGGMTFNLTGSVGATSSTAGSGSITGLPGPFNTPSSPNLTVTGNFALAAPSLTVSLGNSEGECTMALQDSTGSKNQFSGMFKGTATGANGNGTVSSFSVDAGGNVTGSVTVSGATLTLSGTITAQDVATITVMQSGSTEQLTGAAALTGVNGGMTVYMTQGGSSATAVTLHLVPSS